MATGGGGSPVPVSNMFFIGQGWSFLPVEGTLGTYDKRRTWLANRHVPLPYRDWNGIGEINEWVKNQEAYGAFTVKGHYQQNPPGNPWIRLEAEKDNIESSPSQLFVGVKQIRTWTNDAGELRSIYDFYLICGWSPAEVSMYSTTDFNYPWSAMMGHKVKIYVLGKYYDVIIEQEALDWEYTGTSNENMFDGGQLIIPDGLKSLALQEGGEPAPSGVGNNGFTRVQQIKSRDKLMNKIVTSKENGWKIPPDLTP
jgi:hypothetical protein